MVLRKSGMVGTQTDCTLFVMQEQRSEVRGQRLDVVNCGRMPRWNSEFVVAFKVREIVGFSQREIYERVKISN